MATVYEFPVKVKLSKQTEERLYGIAWDYIDALYNALDGFYEEDMDEAELNEVAELVKEAFAKGLYDAIDKYEEEL